MCPCALRSAGPRRIGRNGSQAAKSNFALPGSGGGAGVRGDKVERTKASAEDFGSDADAGEPCLVDLQQRLTAQQAATQDELAANDLSLIKAQAEVTRLLAAKQEFERSVKLDAVQTVLRVQQIQDEVAALEEKVQQG